MNDKVKDDYSELVKRSQDRARAITQYSNAVTGEQDSDATLHRLNAGAITTLQARVKELEANENASDKPYSRIWMAQEINRFTEELAHQKNCADRATEQLALLESGQPCEVNGVMGQWVPVEPSESMIEAWSSLALSRLMNPDANKGLTGAVKENYTAMLTASAQEMKKP